MKLKENLEKAVSDIVKVFEKKHGCRLQGWVADDVTGIADFHDIMFFNLSDICHDIFTDQPKGLIIQWNEECVENYPQDINFRSYCMGLRFDQPQDTKIKEDNVFDKIFEMPLDSLDKLTSNFHTNKNG
jgi:hypothetical protein